MSPKTGRPKAAKPLTIEVKARIDIETNAKLVEYCKENGVTRTDVVRKGIELVLKNTKKNKVSLTLRKYAIPYLKIKKFPSENIIPFRGTSFNTKIQNLKGVILMSRLNAAKAIENGKKCTPVGYTMSSGTLQQIYEKNDGDKFAMVGDSFYLGVTQGMKIAKAEMKKRGGK